MKPVDEKPSIYIAFNKENKKEDPKSEVGDHQRISKHKKIFANGYTQSWSEDDFVIKKVKKAGRMLLLILTVNKLLERFIKKKQIKESLG